MWQREFFNREKSPPTAHKHRILAFVFERWLSALSPAAPRALVFDGFAGAGKFATPRGDNGLGSPLLMLEATLARRAPVQFVFAEKDERNCGALRSAVAEMLGEAPPGHGVSVDVNHTTFEECAADLPLQNLPPHHCFSFVDPYRYGGVTLATVRRLAERGDVLMHLATGALLSKLGSSAATSARQMRRMDLFLGGEGRWKELHHSIGNATGAQAQTALVARVVAYLIDGIPTLQLRQAIPLRSGTTHLLYTSTVHTTPVPPNPLDQPTRVQQV